MKKLVTLLMLILLSFGTILQIDASPTQHITKSGKPDKRYNDSKHLKKDGTMDMRYKSSKKAAAKKKRH